MWDVHVDVAIAAAGMIATEVKSDSAGARRRPDDRQLPGDFGGQDSRRFKAVLNGRRVQDEACHLREIAGRCRDDPAELARFGKGQVTGDAPRHGHAAPEARTEKAGRSLEQSFLNARGVRGRHTESDISAESPDIPNVGKHALQFQSDQADGLRPGWHRDREGVFNCLTAGHGVGERVVAGNRFGNHHRVHQRSVLEELLRAFVGVEVP